MRLVCVMVLLGIVCGQNGGKAFLEWLNNTKQSQNSNSSSSSPVMTDGSTPRAGPLSPSTRPSRWPTPADPLSSSSSPPTILAKPPSVRPSVAPTAEPTSEPTPEPLCQAPPQLRYLLRSAVFSDKCVTIQFPSSEKFLLEPCSPSALDRQAFTSIPQTPAQDAQYDPAAIQLVKGLVFAWVMPVPSASHANQVFLTSIPVYGTTKLLNNSNCISASATDNLTVTSYWFPCLLNQSTAFLLEPVLNAPSDPPPNPPKPGATPQTLGCNSPYNFEGPKTYTPPPATCRPVHMQHIGRHGSRHATDMATFLGPINVLVAAQKAGMLTDYGQKVLQAAQDVVFEVREISVAALMPQGSQEVYGYTSRMAQNFPEILLAATADSPIVADSTDLDRTKNSRKQAFYALRDAGVNVSALVSAFAPSVCSLEYNILRAFEGCRASTLYLADGLTFAPANTLKEQTLANAHNYALDFYNSLFTPGFEVAKNVASDGRLYDRIRFADDMWRQLCSVDLCYNISNVRSGFCSYIPKDLAQLLAYNDDVANYRSYGRFTPVRASYRQSCLLHREVQTDFENFIANKTSNRAHMRFGHMETLLPYLSNMNYKQKDPYFLQDVDWQNREYTGTTVRMASNIQKILYQCNGAGGKPTYVVKLLVNEVEQLVPGCDQMYCPWERYSALAKTWGCSGDEFKQVCDGLVVFCGTTREIALSQQRTRNDLKPGPSALGFGSSAFDDFGPFSAKRYTGTRAMSGFALSQTSSAHSTSTTAVHRSSR